eukprot:5112219-Pyramimonas_sp.AAC.1
MMHGAGVSRWTISTIVTTWRFAREHPTICVGLAGFKPPPSSLRALRRTLHRAANAHFTPTAVCNPWARCRCLVDQVQVGLRDISVTFGGWPLRPDLAHVSVQPRGAVISWARAVLAQVPVCPHPSLNELHLLQRWHPRAEAPLSWLRVHFPQRLVVTSGLGGFETALDQPLLGETVAEQKDQWFRPPQIPVHVREGPQHILERIVGNMQNPSHLEGPVEEGTITRSSSAWRVPTGVCDLGCIHGNDVQGRAAAAVWLHCEY